MSNSVYLGNLPTWVTADDIRSWFDSNDLVCDAVRVIRDFETQESKGYAFVEAPNQEDMESIIQRFHRAPIDGRLLQAKEARPRGERPTAKKSAPRRRKRPTADAADSTGAAVAGPAAEAPMGNLGEVLQKAL